MILDCSASGISEATAQNQRVVLPRGLDVVRDIVASSLKATKGEKVSMMVLDFKDAFYHIPLRHDERRYFVGKHKGRYIVNERVTQGSVNGPTIWGRMAALLGRLVQGLVDDLGGVIHTYVDDPIVILRGTTAERRRAVATVVAAWLALGLDLAFSKGQVGFTVDWIGLHLVVGNTEVIASIKQDFLDELRKDVESTMQSNVVSIKKVRSLAGKAPNDRRL
jgi:hypothetical protein